MREPESTSRLGMAGAIAVGHPVDVATGEFFGTHDDVERRGTVPLLLRRHYNTRFLSGPVGPLQEAGAAPQGASPFGRGWRASWQMELRQTLDGFALTTPEGGTLALPDSRIPGLGFHDTGRLIVPRACVELRRIDAQRIRVIRFGIDREPLTYVFLQTAGSLEYTLARIERTFHAAVELTGDGDRSYLSQTRTGRALRLDWSEGRVTQAALLLPDGSERLVAAYAYDRHGLLAQVSDVSGLVERYDYDAQGRMISSESRSGSVYTIRYDSAGRCCFVSSPRRYQERTLSYLPDANTTNVADSHGAITRYEYNDRGQVLRETSPTGLERVHEFDAMGRPSVTIQASGAVIRTSYDPLGRTAQVVLPDGRARSFDHDDEHRLVAYTDESARTTRHAHDVDGNVVRVTLPSGDAWQYAWNAVGECVTVRDPAGHDRHFTYDANGNRAADMDAAGHVTHRTFNALGQTATRTDGNGFVTSFAYDARAVLMRIVDPDGRTWERHEDITGTQIVYVRPDGRRFVTEQSACGQLLQTTDEEGRITRYDWDSEPGRLLRIVDPGGGQLHIAYDADGHPVRRQSFDDRVVSHAWAGGLLRQTTLSGGETIAWEYDAMERPTKRTAPDGILEYAYDDAGNVIHIEGYGVTTAFDHDVLGRCTAEHQGGLSLYKEIRANEGTVELTAKELPESIRYAFGPDGRGVSIANGGARMTVTRDGCGRDVRRTFAAAGVYDQPRDPCGRVVAQVLVGSDGAPAVQRAIGYDRAGTVYGVRDWIRGDQQYLHDATDLLLGMVHGDGRGDFYAYDAAGNRIGAAHTDDGHSALAQAGAGALAPWTSAAADATTAAESYHVHHNRLLRVDGAARRIGCEYDANGRVVAKHVQDRDGTRTTRFAWDTRGLLVAVNLPDGRTFRYRYDGLGRRIAKVRPDGGETRYVWDGFRISHEIRHDGELVTWSYVDDEVVPAMRRSVREGDLYLLPDISGAPAEVAAGNGAVVKVVRKGVWGEGFDGGVASQPAVGQWFDEESGLHYNVYRYFDPDLGRYLTPDPIGTRGGLNEYAPVPSPVMWMDPLGLANIRCDGDEAVLEIKDKYPPGSRQSRQLRRFVKAWNEEIEDNGGSMTTRRETEEETRASNNYKAQMKRDEPARFEGKVVGHVPDACAGGPSAGGRVMALDPSVNGSIGAQVGHTPPGETYDRVVVVRE